MNRFALLLHGMLGTEVASASGALKPSVSPHSTARDGGRAGRRMLLRHCAATHLRYIVDAQAARGVHVDIFAHSWNPALKPTIERVWRPIWSRSEPEGRNIDKPKK